MRFINVFYEVNVVCYCFRWCGIKNEGWGVWGVIFFVVEIGFIESGVIWKENKIDDFMVSRLYLYNIVFWV